MCDDSSHVNTFNVVYSNVFNVLYSNLLEFHIYAFNFFLENSSWDCQQSPKFKILQNWVYYLDLKIPTPLLPTRQVLSAKTPGIILDHSTSQEPNSVDSSSFFLGLLSFSFLCFYCLSWGSCCCWSWTLSFNDFSISTLTTLPCNFFFTSAKSTFESHTWTWYFPRRVSSSALSRKIPYHDIPGSSISKPHLMPCLSQYAHLQNLLFQSVGFSYFPAKCGVPFLIVPVFMLFYLLIFYVSAQSVSAVEDLTTLWLPSHPQGNWGGCGGGDN